MLESQQPYSVNSFVTWNRLQSFGIDSSFIGHLESQIRLLQSSTLSYNRRYRHIYLVIRYNFIIIISFILFILPFKSLNTNKSRYNFPNKKS